MNTSQHKEDSVAFKLLECPHEKKINNEFLHRYIDDLRSTQIETINDLQLRRKPLKVVSKNYS